MHPDVVYIIGQANSDLPALGEDDGLVETIEFLAALQDKADGHFADGISDAIGFIHAARCLWGSMWVSDPDEYRGRTAELRNLSFDPAALVAALDDVRAQNRPGGYTRAINAIREGRDEAEVPDKPDPDNYDDGVDDDDYAAEVEEYRDRMDYLAGLEYAANQLVDHTGVDPDPDWEPST